MVNTLIETLEVRTDKDYISDQKAEFIMQFLDHSGYQPTRFQKPELYAQKS